MEKYAGSLEEFTRDVQLLNEEIFLLVTGKDNNPHVIIASLVELLKSACEAGGIDRKEFAHLCQDLINDYRECFVEES